ncbi:MAG: CHC2 zinc finger domain-containing protein [Oscillospiraceae bacterium]|nr:CHC2 zinc finger domain-containing protein [Oscillospiraceae bacterium]
MAIFEAVKSKVTPRMAAEHYGLTVSRNGMVRCPFHDDRHPSMKLYEDHFHCFGCQANGDVIVLAAKLFGIAPLKSAQKLAADFGIHEGRPSVQAKLNRHKMQAENERLCFRVLCDYLHILEYWKTQYVPKTSEDEIDPRFTEACHRLERTQYFIDILTGGTLEDRAELVQDLMTENKINRLREQIKLVKEELHEKK